MVLTWANVYVEPVKGKGGKIIAINVSEQSTWDGTAYSTAIPSQKADIERIRTLANGRALELVYLTVYSGSDLDLRAHVYHSGDMAQLTGGLPVARIIDELLLPAGEGVALENGIGIVLNPPYDLLPGDTNSATTKRSLFLLNFGNANLAPDNTETMTVFLQLKVID